MSSDAEQSRQQAFNLNNNAFSLQSSSQPHRPGPPHKSLSGELARLQHSTGHNPLRTTQTMPLHHQIRSAPLAPWPRSQGSTHEARGLISGGGGGGWGAGGQAYPSVYSHPNNHWHHQGGSEYEQACLMSGLHPSSAGPQHVDQEQTKQLLRQINAMVNKEGILDIIATFLPKLDLINQVTCLYRLAKMYSALRATGVKNQWRSELSSHPALFLLLESVKTAVSAQPSALPAGLNARCISNLVWSLVRLELVADSTSSAGAILMNAAVLVENFLQHFNSQGLASLLWGYAKLPQPQLRIAMLLIRRITELLADSSTLSTFDAQGLSNSVWALAHMSFILGSKAPELLIHMANEIGTDINRFLSLIGEAASSILCSLDSTVGVLPDEMTALSSAATARSWVQDAERKFSCQSLVNIAWSFMTLLGQTVVQHAEVHLALTRMRVVLMQRLRASASMLQARMPDALSCSGTVNEQALSNMVSAYDGTIGLDSDLLRLIFVVAAERIHAGGSQPPFKSKELVALLSAANRMPEAEPWEFLSALTRAVDAGPTGALAGWQPCEHDIYKTAASNLRCYSTYLNSALQQGGMQHLQVPPALQPHDLHQQQQKGQQQHKAQQQQQQQQLLPPGDLHGAAFSAIHQQQMLLLGSGGSGTGSGGGPSVPTHGPNSRSRRGSRRLMSTSLGSLMAPPHDAGSSALLSRQMSQQLSHQMSHDHGAVQELTLAMGSLSSPAAAAPCPSPQPDCGTAVAPDVALSLVLELISKGLLVVPYENDKQHALWMRLTAASLVPGAMVTTAPAERISHGGSSSGGGGGGPQSGAGAPPSASSTPNHSEGFGPVAMWGGDSAGSDAGLQL